MKPRNPTLVIALLLVFGSIVWYALRSPHSSSAAKPQYGSFGLDVAGGDPRTKAGDDFFRYANGSWIDSHEIPADKAGYSLRLIM
ncbi:MAG: M13 family peptidase, partial [Candidatus Eiseniibacteriota bacterium]